MKVVILFLLFTFGLSSIVFAQDFISLSKKIPQATLPYTTSNEFLDVELFESKLDFTKNGLIPLSVSESKLLVDNDIDPTTDKYFGVHRLQLTPKIIGIIYYKQIKTEDEELSAYNFSLTTYSLSGKKMATTDFIGYEWIDEESTYEEVEFEEEEELDEMEQELEEITFLEEDTSGMDEYVDEEILNEHLDEGYAFSRIFLENNEIWLERNSISYYSTEILTTSYFKLNNITGEFDEMER